MMTSGTQYDSAHLPPADMPHTCPCRLVDLPDCPLSIGVTWHLSQHPIPRASCIFIVFLTGPLGSVTRMHLLVSLAVKPHS